MWITVLHVLAWLGLLVIYAVGAARVLRLAAVVPARGPKLRNWAHEGEGGRPALRPLVLRGMDSRTWNSLRRPALLGVTIVSVVARRRSPASG